MSSREEKKIRIAISSKSGCGNTTVTKMLSEKLGFRMVNYTFRNLAEERGLEFEEFCRLAQDDPQYDFLVDERQVELAEETDSVLGSRLAIWMLKDADLKVFLTASPEVRASRILKREGGDLQEQMDKTAARDKRDHERYLKLYNLNNDDYAFADLIINTDRMNPEQICEIILKAVDVKTAQGSAKGM
ncbi:MAG: AAA family ATPase [Spirochaetales bacterium]|nr:AAA family ATPase [Spirochaetales bacterium]